MLKISPYLKGFKFYRDNLRTFWYPLVYDKKWFFIFKRDVANANISEREREREREITYSYFLVMKTNEPTDFMFAAFHIYIKGRRKTIPWYVFTEPRNILIFRIMLLQLSIVTLVSLRRVYIYIYIYIYILFSFFQIMVRMMNWDNVLYSKWKANLKYITRKKFYYTY